MTKTGTLYVVGTPIGNLEDMSPRAKQVLSLVDVVMCEDTRVTDNLFKRLEIPGKRSLYRMDEHLQLKMAPKVIQWLSEGLNVALVTDAGMPCVSDPGWRVVDMVREQELSVEVIPGPTALTTAIAAVGMDASRVWFGGFLPKKAGKRQEQYEWVQEQLKNDMITLAVWYESPMRLQETLREIVGYKGQVALGGELTKMYERVIRGTAEEVLQLLPEEIKGEWVLVWGK